MNAEAVQMLEERAAQLTKQKVNGKKSEIFNMSAFG